MSDGRLSRKRHETVADRRRNSLFRHWDKKPDPRERTLFDRPRLISSRLSSPQHFTFAISTMKRSKENDEKADCENKKPKVDGDSAAPGFCSSPSSALSKLELAMLLTTVETEEQDDSVSFWFEKDLIGEGRSKKCLYNVNNKLCFYFDGKKCVKKDRIRIQAMVEAARNLGHEKSTAYVLLAEHSGICNRNTLPELVSSGFVVQRVASSG